MDYHHCTHFFTLGLLLFALLHITGLVHNSLTGSFTQCKEPINSAKEIAVDLCLSSFHTVPYKSTYFGKEFSRSPNTTSLSSKSRLTSVFVCTGHWYDCDCNATVATSQKCYCILQASDVTTVQLQQNISCKLHVIWRYISLARCPVGHRLRFYKDIS